MSAPVQRRANFSSTTRTAARRPCAAFRQLASPALQQPDGYWCARLTADTTLESDYILFQLWMYPPAERRVEAARPGR